MLLSTVVGKTEALKGSVRHQFHVRKTGLEIRKQQKKKKTKRMFFEEIRKEVNI